MMKTFAFKFNILRLPRSVLSDSLCLLGRISIFKRNPVLLTMNIHEPGHEKMCLMSYANNKGAALDSIAKISRL